LKHTIINITTLPGQSTPQVRLNNLFCLNPHQPHKTHCWVKSKLSWPEILRWPFS